MPSKNETAIKYDALQVVENYLNKARELWPDVDFPQLAVTFDLRGTTAGMAYSRSGRIKINMVLYRENIADFQSDTIPHEVAHVVAYHVHTARTGRRIKPHGREWQGIMRAFGLEPTRCHSYDTSRAKVRTERKVPVSCGCGRWTELGIRRAKRAIRAGGNYGCPHCKQPILIREDWKRKLMKEVLA
jgi:SprT protein